MKGLNIEKGWFERTAVIYLNESSTGQFIKEEVKIRVEYYYPNGI